jgi:carboxylesterase type B
VGSLRFEKPLPPKKISGVQDGGDTSILCPQASPKWLSDLTGTSTKPPGESEDCLYLDVYVPEKVFANRKSASKTPVLVWIYGGGDVIGYKDQQGSPAGLIKRGLEDTDSDGVIYVALNYRV